MTLITKNKQMRTTVTVTEKNVNVRQDNHGRFESGKKPKTVPSVLLTVSAREW